MSTGFYCVSPDNERIPVPKELFNALRRFLDGAKPTGTLTIECRNGGVTGVQVAERLK